MKSLKEKSKKIISIKNGNYFISNSFSLKNINLNIYEGDVIGIVGKNGAGKTTLLNLLSGINYWDEGKIKYETKNIGYCFDDLSVPMDLNINEIQNVLKKLVKKWDDQFFECILDKLELPRNKACKDFSKGMKMQLNVAITLAHKPEILLLDEVTAGLDLIMRRKILKCISNYNQKYNVPIVLTTHNLADVNSLCTKLILVNDGEISKEEKVSNKSVKNIENDFINVLRKNDRFN